MTKPTFADAEPKSLVYLAVEIGNDHPVPQSWKERGVITDEDESTGHARILIDTDSSVIHRMEMNIDGVFLSDDGDSSVNILYAFRGRDAPAQDCTPDGPSLSDQVAVLCLA